MLTAPALLKLPLTFRMLAPWTLRVPVCDKLPDCVKVLPAPTIRVPALVIAPLLVPPPFRFQWVNMMHSRSRQRRRLLK